jgi:hypothetical protein
MLHTAIDKLRRAVIKDSHPGILWNCRVTIEVFEDTESKASLIV